MIEHENGLIVRLITEPTSIKNIYGKVNPEMFNNTMCRDAYTEIIRHYDKTGEIHNIVSLAPKLESNERDKSDVMTWLKTIVESDMGIGSTKSYVDGIVADYKVNRLRNLFDTSDLKSGAVESTISNLISELEALKDNKQRDSHSLAEITKRSKDKYFIEHEEGIKTGITSLDDIILCLGKGDVTVIGARPSVGKSAFATQIITTVAKTGKRVGYFNLEMSDEQIFERIIASTSGIDLNRIRRAISFIGEEKQKYDEAVEKLEKFTNLEIFSGSYSASEIKHKCRNQDFDLVVIDYLQIVKPDKMYGNRVAEVGDISKTIKALAMELKVPVIALSQLNRSKKATDEPEINDLRESGDIEQDASTILFLWNIDEFGQYKGISVEKNRQGIKGKKALEFDGSHMTFTPCVDDVETLTKALGGMKNSYGEETFTGW